MKKYVCEPEQCVGCGACIDVCNKNAITLIDHLTHMESLIDSEKCVNCNACHNVCPNNHLVDLRKQILWMQGWSNDSLQRANSSSGGFAAVLERKFVQEGGVVCSCLFEKGEFVFRTAITIDQVERFRGSKYVKSNPQGIYKQIKTYLKEGKKVLFVGLPCQVAAVINFVGKKLEENLFTVDLICHGTPSSKILEIYLQQHGIDLKKIHSIAFRSNNTFNLKENDKNIIDFEIQDRYTMAFLSSLIYTDNCYSCKYATEKRAGDLTIGDSWGSELSEEEINKGISLILCQTEKGKQLLENLPFHMEEVDLKKAILNNHQLEHPSKAPKQRGFLFSEIKRGKKFDAVVAKICPKACLKQDIKKLLKKFLGGGTIDNYRLIIWK